MAAALEENEEIIRICMTCKPRVRKLADAKKILQENEKWKAELEEVREKSNETRKQVKQLEEALNNKKGKNETAKRENKRKAGDKEDNGNETETDEDSL